MGELHGRGEPDRPEPTPEDARHPPLRRLEVRDAAGPRPAPDPADVLVNHRDRPGPHAPDAVRPSGTELLEKDATGASDVDKVRKKLFDKEFLGDLTDVTDHAGDTGYKLLMGPKPTGQEVRTPKPVWHRPPDQGLDGGQALTAMLVTGCSSAKG